MKRIPRYYGMILLLLLLPGLASLVAASREQNTGESPTGMAVYDIVKDGEGVLWFATEEGLFRYDRQEWKRYSKSDHLASDLVTALSLENTGEGQVLWAATDQGVNELSLDADGINGSIAYTSELGLLEDSVSDIVIDSRGIKYFSSKSGLTYLDQGVIGQLVYEEHSTSMLNGAVRKLSVFNDTIYLAQPMGVGRFVSGVDGITGASRMESGYGVLPFSGNILSLLVTGKESQWYGTDVGLQLHSSYDAKIDWQLYSTAEGLAGDAVTCLYEDDFERLWIGTTSGVSRYDGENFENFTKADGLPGDTVYAVAQSSPIKYWLGTQNGACELVLTGVPERILKKETLEATAWWNKARGEVSLRIHAERPEVLHVTIWSLEGKQAGQVELEVWEGENETSFQPAGAATLSPGLYLLNIRAGEGTLTEKLLIH